MFSHFLDGGGEENGMDESYNDDDAGGYEGKKNFKIKVFQYVKRI